MRGIIVGWCRLAVIGLIASAAVLAQGLLGVQAAPVEPNTARHGYDYSRFNLPSGANYQWCQTACRLDQRCRAWTYLRGPRQCRLKFYAAVPVPNPCCVSGTKAFGGGGPGPGKQAKCHAYAQRAVAQFNESLVHRCGFGGARWQGDFRPHYNWCLNARATARRSEEQAREAQLRQCKAAAGGRRAQRYCDHFARVAIAQQATAAKAGCGFNGSEWRRNYQQHVRRCLNRGIDRSRDRLQKREDRIFSCM